MGAVLYYWFTRDSTRQVNAVLYTRIYPCVLLFAVVGVHVCLFFCQGCCQLMCVLYYLHDSGGEHDYVVVVSS